MFGLVQDAWLTMEQSQIAVCGPDPKQVIPEGTASLVVWIKATLRSLYLDNGDCPPGPVMPSGTPPSMEQMVCFIYKLSGIMFMIIGIFIC